MILLILSIFYFLLVAADVGMTLWAVRHGKTKEVNPLLHPLMASPWLLILCELVLYALVVIAASVFWPILVFAIMWRGMILINNINVVRG